MTKSTERLNQAIKIINRPCHANEKVEKTQKQIISAMKMFQCFSCKIFFEENSKIQRENFPHFGNVLTQLIN
jgi:hypothetical protein